MKLIILLLLSAIVFNTKAEQLDVSGNWSGTASFMQIQFNFKYELRQTNNKITGFSYIKTLNGKDSAKVSIKGEINGNHLTLIPIKFIYKVGVHCASVANLIYSLQDSQEALLGKWSGDLSFTTCAPLTSGNISVFKEQPSSKMMAQEPLTEKDNNRLNTIEIATSDDIGLALIRELKKRTYYALIIGVNQYEDSGIPALDNPIKDAHALAQVLKTYYSFEKEHVNVLTNPNRGEIIDALDAINKDITDKDNLLIFYAGHGIWNEQLKQGYWLPSNAALNSKAEWLSNSTLRDYLRGINTKHTLLISDACFSGGILKERAVFENSRAILEVYKLPSRKAMTSGTLKTVPDKSVFIEYLLKNLIQNESPLISADQLFRQFKIAVINNSPNGQVPQYGPITQAGDEGGDFVFLKR